MNFWAVLGVVGLSAFSGATAHAERPDFTITGNELDLKCKSKSERDKGYCSGFIAAVVSEWDGDITSVTSFCLPDRATRRQAGAVIYKALKDDPANLHRPADLLIKYALSKAFPCPEVGRDDGKIELVAPP